MTLTISWICKGISNHGNQNSLTFSTLCDTLLELRSWRKNRGSEDRKIGTAMIGQSLGIRMIGSDISRINTNSTLISIAGTTVTACHRSQQCWFQFRKTTKCFERDKVYILYKRKLLTSNVNQS